MAASFFVIAHALGGVQGAFLAGILAGKRRSSLPNRLLAVTMLAFAIDLGMAVFHSSGAEREFPHLIGIDYPLGLLYGPLLYLYARTLSRAEQGWRPAYAWHFGPFVAACLIMLPFYVLPGETKVAYLQDQTGFWWSGILIAVNHLKLILAFGYVIAILPMLKRHRLRVHDSHSEVERVNLLWLRNLVLAIVVLTTFAGILYLLSLRETSAVVGLDPESSYDDYTLLGLAAFVYAIGYFGLRQPEVFDARDHSSIVADAVNTSIDVPESPEPRPRYARSGLDEEALDICVRALECAMSVDRLYRNGDLTLQDLATAVDLAPHHITEALNTRLGVNFYEFVNGYRVRDVQAQLSDPSRAAHTLLAVGMEAGFNSKSTFNLVFKKYTGVTPSAYRKRAAQRQIA